MRSHTQLGTVHLTNGLPSRNVGKNGDIATDPITGKLYIKSDGGWAYKGQGIDSIFSATGGGGVEITPGDPLLFNLFPYELTAAPAPAGAVNLYWTYPLNNVPSASDTTTFTMRLYLQRSYYKTNNPLAPAFWNLDTGSPTLAAETGWDTIRLWSPGEAFPTNYDGLTPQICYTDSDPFPNGVHIANYRLVVKYQSAGTWVEVDWNIATAFKPYVFVPNPPLVDAQGVHLHWE